MASGCPTSPQSYCTYRLAGRYTTTLCWSQLYPPVKDYKNWPQIIILEGELQGSLQRQYIWQNQGLSVIIVLFSDIKKIEKMASKIEHERYLKHC